MFSCTLEIKHKSQVSICRSLSASTCQFSFTFQNPRLVYTSSPQLVFILRFGASLGYEGPLLTITSPNLSSALLDPAVIRQKLDQDIFSGRVISATQLSPFISSPLGLVLKQNGDLRRIHHLSYSRGSSVNDFILKEAVNLKYATLANVFIRIR